MVRSIVNKLIVCAYVAVITSSSSSITTVSANDQQQQQQSSVVESKSSSLRRVAQHDQQQSNTDDQNQRRLTQTYPESEDNYGSKSIQTKDNYNSFLPNGSSSVLVKNELEQLISHNTNSNANNNNNDKDLTVVIHIGPMKTGSSSIQSSFGAVLAIPEEADNYEDMGLSLPDDLETYNLIGCFRDPNAKTDEFIICKPETLPHVHKIASRGHNLIVSAEYLTSPDTNIGALKAFLQPWKRQRVVAYYRRYYDWLQSFHNQGNKKLPTDVRETLPYFLTKEMKTKFWYEKMYIIESLNRWKEYFNDFKVFNIYQMPDGDVRESFWCEALPDAHQACAKFQRHKVTQFTKEKPPVNPSVAFVYEDLAYYAIELNLVAPSNNITGITIRDLAVKAKKYQEKVLGLTKYDFGTYLVCPDDETSNYLLTISLQTEQILFPEYYAQQGENEIRKEFDLYKRTHLCHVDAKTLLLNDVKWRHFFESL